MRRLASVQYMLACAPSSDSGDNLKDVCPNKAKHWMYLIFFTHFLDVKPQIMAQLMQQCPIEIGQCTWEWSAQPRYDRSTIQTFNALEGTHPRYDQGRMWRPYNTWACYKEWAAHPWYDRSLWKKILQSNPGHIHPSMRMKSLEIFEQSPPNKKVSSRGHNLISDSQVSVLTHLETDHSLMSSCGQRRWNILYLSVQCDFTPMWCFNALAAHTRQLFRLRGGCSCCLIIVYCLHTSLPTSPVRFSQTDPLSLRDEWK